MNTKSLPLIQSLLVLMILFSGCATMPPREQIASLDYGAYPENYEEIVKKYFEDILIDPYSAHYDVESVRQKWIKESPLMGGRLLAGYLVRVSVNAKNRFGGYTGKELFGLLIKDGVVIKQMNEVELRNLREY